MPNFSRFLRANHGVTAVEYALLAFILAGFIAVYFFGQNGLAPTLDNKSCELSYQMINEFDGPDDLDRIDFEQCNQKERPALAYEPLSDELDIKVECTNGQGQWCDAAAREAEARRLAFLKDFENTVQKLTQEVASDYDFLDNCKNNRYSSSFWKKGFEKGKCVVKENFYKIYDLITDGSHAKTETEKKHQFVEQHVLKEIRQNYKKFNSLSDEKIKQQVSRYF